jgi:hypothetical protein
MIEFNSNASAEAKESLKLPKNWPDHEKIQKEKSLFSKKNADFF